MDSTQLSLFSGDIPDESIDKINKKKVATVTNTISTEGNKNTMPVEDKKELEQKQQIVRKSFEELTTEEEKVNYIYQNFKRNIEPSSQNKLDTLEKIKQVAQKCLKCKLHAGRTNLVFSDGNPDAPIILIGEGPGENEDKTGIPFVGKAGQLLTKILESGEIHRDKDVYVINVVKCRPPENRAPLQAEIDACYMYLEKQIDLASGKIILLAGSTAMKAILGGTSSISKMRGEWVEWKNRFVMPIFHPSYLLRNNSKEVGSPKWLMWKDIKKVKQKLEEIRGNN